MPNLNYKIDGKSSGTRNGTPTDKETTIELIIDLILGNNKISRAEMADKLNISVRTLQRIISDCDRINFVGKGKNGHWIILK